ncbi:hypothetical protein H1V43_24965 [Streptomyces sp. PSKA54]|uniref:Uncharacterized protein n=1 Tax=Streptomyces himalayensis subsp. aureolus TaxID=2758039 RepID=A0A7W2D4D6_9ACTN|nr:hypothetical protein [Streptomyces himalayensis]MBA4864546.1 hypothetical protein [Streptomyces himalayensis subsp. aureolus]
MLTIHVAEASPDLAVAVEGNSIVAVGAPEELAAARPGARVRRWPGILMPGLLNPYGPELLEQTYHPDPREAGELGSEPLTGPAAQAVFGADEARRGASARRGVQRMLAHGTVAVAGQLRNRAVLDAVRRAGLATAGRTEPQPGVPALDPWATGRPVVWMPGPAVGGSARFAVFDARDEAELAELGGGTCVATVIGGRLVYRRR